MTNGEAIRYYKRLYIEIENIRESLLILENNWNFNIEELKESKNKSILILLDAYLNIKKEIEWLESVK